MAQNHPGSLFNFNISVGELVVCCDVGALFVLRKGLPHAEYVLGFRDTGNLTLSVIVQGKCVTRSILCS